MDWNSWKVALEAKEMRNTSEEVPLVLLQGSRALLNWVLEFLMQWVGKVTNIDVLAFPTNYVSANRPAKK